MTTTLNRPSMIGSYKTYVGTHTFSPIAMHVQVQQQHIDGARSGATNCPIARALGSGYFVGKHVVRNANGKSLAVLPKIAREFIERFDDGLAVEPISFDLKLGD